MYLETKDQSLIGNQDRVSFISALMLSQNPCEIFHDQSILMPTHCLPSSLGTECRRIQLLYIKSVSVVLRLTL